MISCWGLQSALCQHILARSCIIFFCACIINLGPTVLRPRLGMRHHPGHRTDNQGRALSGRSSRSDLRWQLCNYHSLDFSFRKVSPCTRRSYTLTSASAQQSPNHGIEPLRLDLQRQYIYIALGYHLSFLFSLFLILYIIYLLSLAHNSIIWQVYSWIIQGWYGRLDDSGRNNDWLLWQHMRQDWS